MAHEVKVRGQLLAVKGCSSQATLTTGHSGVNANLAICEKGFSSTSLLLYIFILYALALSLALCSHTHAKFVFPRMQEGNRLKNSYLPKTL